MKRLNNLFFIFFLILFNFSFRILLAADCEDVDGATSTITSNCTELTVTGDGSNITINSGVTISGATSNNRHAIRTTSSTNTTITNNGNIGPTNMENFGIFHDTGSGSITLLNNTGTIHADDDTAIWNKSTITTLQNSGTIKSDDRNGIANGAGGVITNLTNSGTIWAVDDWAIKNITGTIGTITNTGTIKTNDATAIRNFGGNISTINNSDTISAKDNTIENKTDSTITDIINSSTITSTGNKGKTIRNEGAITTINNSGTISATHSSGSGSINNFSTGTIGEITNSGTISATGNNGIENDGTITEITNTGTITGAGNSIGIDNDGTITTLNNSQGASSSALTYNGTLPTNYNIIINSGSDYGKITFSNVSGTCNVGINSFPSLAGETTYSSVIDGLTSSNIASSMSGISIVGAIKNEWILVNSSGNIWDLKIARVNISDDTNTSIINSSKPNVLAGINNLNSVTEVNFANMNTYDCDLFGENKSCFSLGGRHTSISNPTTKANSFVLVSGFKVSERFRIGGFYHSNMNHRTPSTFSLSDKTPLLGTFFIWNENENKLGYQFKLANAFQKKNATLRRAIVGDSEKGIGRTVIGAESYVAELQYAYQVNDKILLQPYFSTRQASIKQDAYTETGISSPLTFNKIEDKSSTILLGLKFENSLTSKLSLKGSFGIEYDINHTIDKIEPTGISGLTTVSLDNSFKSTRPVVSAGWNYYFSTSQKLSAIFQYQELAYESKTESNAYLYYTFGF